MAPPKTTRSARPKHVHLTAPADVGFFLGVVVFLIIVFSGVIFAQRVKLVYLSREFPRVAEHNYRALQHNLELVERRLARRIDEALVACQEVSRSIPHPYLTPPRLQPGWATPGLEEILPPQ